MIGTLGHKLFVPLTENNRFDNAPSTSSHNELLFFLKRSIRRSGKTVNAVCKQTREGFVGPALNRSL